MGPVHPYCTDEQSFIRPAWDVAMRRTMVSRLTFDGWPGSHARAQVPGLVDPTDLKVGVLNIDDVRCQPLLPTQNAGGRADR
jgi:hypothetical protein